MPSTRSRVQRQYRLVEHMYIWTRPGGLVPGFAAAQRGEQAQFDADERPACLEQVACHVMVVPTPSLRAGCNIATTKTL